MDEYGRVLNNSSELLLRCQDMQVSLNWDKLRAENMEELTRGLNLELDELPPIEEETSTLASSKNIRKVIVKAMLSEDLKRISERLAKLQNEYSGSLREKQDQIK